MTPLHEDDAPRRRPTMVRVVALVVIVAMIATAAAVLWTALTSVRSIEQESDDRVDALAIAEQFTVRANNFDSADPKVYEDSVRPLLTTRYQAEWTERFEELQTLEGDGGVASTGEVKAAGVTSIDSDSATVLVAADTTVEVAGQPVLGVLRWQVNLFKVADEWLVDDYQRVDPGGLTQ